jgi:hypothetical protein
MEEQQNKQFLNSSIGFLVFSIQIWIFEKYPYPEELVE